MSTIHDTWIWITCWMEIYIYLGVNVSNTQKAIFTKNLTCCLWKRSTVHGAYISSFSWKKIFINFWTNQPSNQKRIIFSKDHTDTLGKIFIIQDTRISNRILNKKLISMLKFLKKLISLKKRNIFSEHFRYSRHVKLESLRERKLALISVPIYQII